MDGAVPRLGVVTGKRVVPSVARVDCVCGACGGSAPAHERPWKSLLLPRTPGPVGLPPRILKLCSKSTPMLFRIVLVLGVGGPPKGPLPRGGATIGPFEIILSEEGVKDFILRFLSDVSTAVLLMFYIAKI